MWGAATSAHQVEGGNQWNDWWAWEAAGKVPERSGRATDHFHRFKEDFRLARSLGHTAHRFSIEWSRLEPSEGKWDEVAFRHYDEVFEALAAENLEPVVTLHHFTNPQWFAEKGGWLRPDAAEIFGRYAKRVAERFGRRARFWITINEPLIYLYHGFLTGLWPPGVKSMTQARRIFSALLRGHIAAYQALHEHSQNPDCRVSIAHHVIAFAPCRPGSWLDRWAVSMRAGFINQLIVKALQSGFLFYPGIFCEKLPARKTLDYLGLNYYSRDFVRFEGLSPTSHLGEVCDKGHHCHQVESFTDLKWEVYPRGIHQIVDSFRWLGLPILITENGIATGDDRRREHFIEAHLGELERARKEGASIFGYFYWSLVDNFEWAEGFRPRFGIVEVDYATGERRVRPSAEILRKNCQKLFKN